MLKILNKKTILILGTVTLSVTIALAQSYGCKGGCLGVGSGYNIPGGSANVKFIQGIIGAKQDGIFGAETRAKLALWQKANGVLSDGVLGDQTIAKMKEKMTGTPEGQQQLGELMQSSFPQGSEKMIQNIEDLTNGIKPNPELPPNTVNIPPSDTPSTPPPPPDSNIWSVDEMKRLANTIGEQTNQLRTDQSLTPEQRQELIAARNDAIDELDRQIRRKADYQDEDIPENKELQDLKKVEGPDPEQPQPEPYKAANAEVPGQNDSAPTPDQEMQARDSLSRSLQNIEDEGNQAGRTPGEIAGDKARALENELEGLEGCGTARCSFERNLLQEELAKVNEGANDTLKTPWQSTNSEEPMTFKERLEKMAQDLNEQVQKEFKEAKEQLFGPETEQGNRTKEEIASDMDKLDPKDPEYNQKMQKLVDEMVKADEKENKNAKAEEGVKSTEKVMYQCESNDNGKTWKAVTGNVSKLEPLATAQKGNVGYYKPGKGESAPNVGFGNTNKGAVQEEKTGMQYVATACEKDAQTGKLKPSKGAKQMWIRYISGSGVNSWVPMNK